MRLPLLAFVLAACLPGAGSSVAAAQSLSFRVTAHVPLACRIDANGETRCNTPSAPGEGSEAARRFGASSATLVAMPLRVDPQGWVVRSFVAF
ncbi:hypothetical protein [Neomegalonema sp.]|uniref:hypothetical protein n=1 Tax=Neomegalonema sp. TaxID=2039713 RepID=UPI002633A60E|nr:hypothetical protein [Neomegalonema sp.]MDD2868147.1 hypothetical protein [Neomegalonema sp.]